MQLQNNPKIKANNKRSYYSKRTYSFSFSYKMSYLFNKPVPMSLVLELLEKICTKHEPFYMIDMNAYRKMIFHEYHKAFCDDLLTYYHPSKKYFITRELTYNSFTNIIRQICKSNKYHFYTELKYDYSVYTILFFVAIPVLEDSILSY